MDNVVALIDRRIAKLLGRKGAKGAQTWAKVMELKALKIDIEELKTKQLNNK
jgi:hypothetical protein